MTFEVLFFVVAIVTFEFVFVVVAILTFEFVFNVVAIVTFEFVFVVVTIVIFKGALFDNFFAHLASLSCIGFHFIPLCALVKVTSCALKESEGHDAIEGRGRASFWLDDVW